MMKHPSGWIGARVLGAPASRRQTRGFATQRAGGRRQRSQERWRMAVAAVCDRRKMSGQYNGDAHRAPLQMKAKMTIRIEYGLLTATPERSASPGSAGVPPAGGGDSQRNEPAGRQRSQERWRMAVAAVCDRRYTNPRTGMFALRSAGLSALAARQSAAPARRVLLTMNFVPCRRPALRGAVQPAILYPPSSIFAFLTAT